MAYIAYICRKLTWAMKVCELDTYFIHKGNPFTHRVCFALLPKTKINILAFASLPILVVQTTIVPNASIKCEQYDIFSLDAWTSS